MFALITLLTFASKELSARRWSTCTSSSFTRLNGVLPALRGAPFSTCLGRTWGVTGYRSVRVTEITRDGGRKATTNNVTQFADVNDIVLLHI